MRDYRSVRTLAPIAILIALFAAAPAFGSTIVSITGGGTFIERGDSDDWGAQGWTQTGSYTDGTIRGTFGDGYFQAAGSAFLEERVGNHAVEIPSTDFVFPKDPTQIKLFTDLSLGPGTYYLATFGQGDWISDPIEDSPTITAASDVSDVTDTLVSRSRTHLFRLQQWNISGVSRHWQRSAGEWYTGTTHRAHAGRRRPVVQRCYQTQR
jgi:hypothetical protein